jgi:Family of unknown function (DUF6962)
MPLSEPASSLTDLALGLVALWLALRLRGTPAGRRHWTAAFGWTAAAALAGAVHHGVITYSAEWRDASWAAISGLVVVAVSYILAATVVEVLGSGHARTFWILRSASLVAYVVVALTGHAGIQAILLCEGVTMACILTLWGMAARDGHPRARAVIVALVASMGAAVMRAVPWGELPLGFDANAIYHLSQIPGVVLLYLAVRDPAPEVAPAPAQLRAEVLPSGARR